MQLVGQAAVDYSVRHGVTMVIVTEIKSGKEAAYRAWADRIQKLQATFPGYLGSFVQPPQHQETGWTTVLRFDSAANLEGWLKSDCSIRNGEVQVRIWLRDSMRNGSTRRFQGGWRNPTTGAPPNMWKTACLVLLTLFPVVMLELRFLNPHLEAFNPAVRTFIGNAISVALTTWPLMPLAIFAFRDWLFPEGKPSWQAWAMPIALLLCYLVEIAVFWHLLL